MPSIKINHTPDANPEEKLRKAAAVVFCRQIKSNLIVVMLMLLAIEATAQILTIDSCYVLAVKNYPLVKQYDLVEKTKEYTLSNASKAYLPQVSATAIGGYIFGGLPASGSPGSESSNLQFIGIAQVNQTLWDGGATRTQKNIINASSEAEKAAVSVQLNDLRTRVNQLFFGVLLLDEQLKQLEVQNAILSHHLDRAKQLNENGLAYKTDIDEIRVEQLKLKQQRTAFNYTRNGYITMLSFLVGVDLNGGTVFQKPMVNHQVAALQLNRPELSLYKSQRNLVNAQAGMQKVNLMPKIGLLGAGMVFAPGINFGPGKLSAIGVAGVSASWKINGLYTNNNDKQLTQLGLHKINVQEELFVFNTKLQMTQAMANIDQQKAILENDEEIISLRQTIREGYQLKYEGGAGPLMDVLNATEKEGEARAQKALHEMQLLITLYDYKTTTGN